ncbi:SUMF1/EgtB/PvdO family nonheme iron enzyme [Microcoleus sp. FACHB-SPT15]|uniref:caspase, EACC1-associated type n=1 Tax=Microcoleus sp. FACHB-SPT15 TaxID=2692830 RepID=UPI00177B53DB|nr:SUMF1/EgtB/PvdO family nonheme iron enzyme [Microcoleus sp. FACHB-SPT15]MBD1808871.1 SUMF1/EgtB/PvdO family nonheme iron enzyme [Microcoleus sp. FACHB-SPT15]
MTKVALLIGVSEYEPGLNPLPGAVKDVEAMHQVLAHPEMGGFAQENITVLKNPQRQAIEDAIYKLFDNRQKDDLLLFYFSGHGVKDESGKLYLSTRATHKNNGRLVKPSAVAASTLHESINESKSQRQVVILDCCFSGAIAKGMSVKDDGTVNVQEQLGGKGRAILTSSTSTQYSFEQEGSELSVYTQYLVEGIEKGAADQDNDGWISIDELHEYASSKVREAAPAMTPEFYPVQEGHKILLAKSPKDDPKLKYRKEVERRINRGKFSIPARRLLNSLYRQLKLDAEVAAAIEAEVQQPYLEYQRKLEEYESTLIEAIEAESTLSETTLNDLRDYQQHLGLRDEDVAVIEERIIGEQKAIGLIASMEQLLVSIKAVQSTPSNFTEDLGNGITLEMVAIPGGTFLMGSPESEQGRSGRESPQHTVTIQPFFMGKFSVTQAQWQAVVSLPKVNIDLKSDPSNFKGANRPVERVSWNDAVEFCARLSKATGREYRLPSEAEWEYACRAGTTTPFHFGETITTDLANYNGNYNYGSGSKGQYREQTTDTGSFPANTFGLHDMHGNVWEWCQDTWHENYNGAPTDGSAWVYENANQNRRILRGGSWDGNPGDCRSASRLDYSPDFDDDYIGFRVVCEFPRTF